MQQAKRLERRLLSCPAGTSPFRRAPRIQFDVIEPDSGSSSDDEWDTEDLYRQDPYVTFARNVVRDVLRLRVFSEPELTTLFDYAIKNAPRDLHRHVLEKLVNDVKREVQRGGPAQHDTAHSVHRVGSSYQYGADPSSNTVRDRPRGLDSEDPYERFAYDVVSKVVHQRVRGDEQLIGLCEEMIVRHLDTLDKDRMLSICVNIKRELRSRPLAEVPREV
eukprot:TRINITY_DN19187_c0_g1_i2.p1 TRINITY_DN19187_c0_g1~~TRINITY_DN19187_c0_g1_i2.p1  ORF type:complete len:219 (-),score=38.60 TRINITY_DN19187_c0_g1_i2:174-830(-)